VAPHCARNDSHKWPSCPLHRLRPQEHAALNNAGSHPFPAKAGSAAWAIASFFHASDVLRLLLGHAFAESLKGALLADSPEVAGGGRLPVRSHVQTDFPRQNGGMGFGLTGALAGANRRRGRPMPDQQELQLVVTLVDQASAGLRAIKGELQQTGASGADKLKQGAEDVEKHSKNIGENTRKIHEGINEALRDITKFASQVTGLPLREFTKIAGEATKGVGGFTVAMGAVPPLLYELNNLVGEFA
jgi:hypothetical protein